LIDVGIIVCIAAGNDAHKMSAYSASTSDDWNNYITTTGGTIYYQRGSSPNNKINSTNPSAILVGALYATTYSASLDQRIQFSNAGPQVDIWAAGVSVRSAYSTTNTASTPYTTATYYLNDSYKQLTDMGTSMASPQVAGICACYLQQNPTATPAQVKDWLTSNAITSAIYSTGLDNDYTSATSLLGGPRRIAYLPSQGATISGAITLSNVTLPS
jgi:serine protease